MSLSGRRINRGDTARDPGVAMGLLQGITLPVDLEVVPSDPRKIGIQLAHSLSLVSLFSFVSFDILRIFPTF